MIAFREGENMLSIYRRHGLILAAEVAPIVLFAFILTGVGFFAMGQLPEEMAPLRALVALGLLMLLHVFWIALFIILADFFLDVWVLTDQRMIAIEQRGLFARTVSEFELARVQDVTVEIHGVIPTLFNYGNIIVRTASEHENFMFKQVWHPNMVKDALIRASRGQAAALSLTQSHQL